MRRIAKSELVLALTAVALLTAFAPTSSHQTGSPAVKTKPCQKAHGPFHVLGTKVIGAHGKVFIPYGITVPGLSNSDYQPFVPLDDAKIRATAAGWCANTVRLQIAPNNLVGENGHVFNRKYLQAIEGEVRTAEKAGLVVVLNAQTENVGDQPDPGDGDLLEGPRQGLPE